MSIFGCIISEEMAIIVIKSGKAASMSFYHDKPGIKFQISHQKMLLGRLIMLEILALSWHPIFNA